MCVFVWFILHWALLFFLYQFSRLSFTCVCLRSRFGIENVETKMWEKKLWNIFSLSHTVLDYASGSMTERSNRLLRSYEKKHNTAICAEEASAWNSSFVFLSLCLFLGIFLRCFVPVWLSRSHSERCRNKLVLHFNTIVVSACRMWIPFKDSVTLTESLCVLFSSCLGCKILSIESRCWALCTLDIHFRWDLDCNSTWN